MSSPSSSQDNSSPTRSGNDEDEIELARGVAETGLKSEDEEILCNYGDKVLLDGVSEDSDVDESEIVSEMVEDGDPIRVMSPPKPKPAQANWPTTKVRFFVGGRLFEKEVFVEDQGKEVKGGTEEEKVIEGEYDEENSEESDYSSLAPDESYSSLTDYMVGLKKKKVVKAGGAITEDDEKKIVNEAAIVSATVAAATASSFDLTTTTDSSDE